MKILDKLIGLRRNYQHETAYQRGIKRGKEMARERFVVVLSSKKIINEGLNAARDYVPGDVADHKLGVADFMQGYSKGFETAREIIKKLP